MKFQLACGDVMPGCPTTFSNESREGLLGAVAAHASEAHGLTSISPEVASAVDAQVRQVD